MVPPSPAVAVKVIGAAGNPIVFPIVFPIFTLPAVMLIALNIVKNDALFISLLGDDFAPMRSMLALSCYFRHPQIETLDLTRQLKGNQHAVWIKQPNEVVKLIQEWLNHA